MQRQRNIIDLSGYGLPRPAVELPAEPKMELVGASSSSEEEITLEYIVKNKPSTKIVREFMGANLGVIQSEEQKLFG